MKVGDLWYISIGTSNQVFHARLVKQTELLSFFRIRGKKETQIYKTNSVHFIEFAGVYMQQTLNIS